MREIFLIIRGNVRKNKSSYIGIAVLMFIVSLSLSIVLSTLINIDERDRELLKSSGIGNVMGAMKFSEDETTYQDHAKGCRSLAEEIASCDGVDHVDLLDALFLNIEDLNGKGGNSSCFIFDAENPKLQYPIYDAEKNIITDLKLNSGEIVVPISFQTLYGSEIGDVITLRSGYVDDVDENGNPIKYQYKIAAYMEDPYMGASIMGIKTMLISTEDMNQFKEREDWALGFMLSVFKEEENGLTDIEFDAMLNRETAYSSRTWISLTHTQANKYTTMLVNIFSAILIGFVAMIVVATLIVLSHSINSSIEQDFSNLGILKAMGVTGGKIKCSIMLGYMLSAITGGILGIPVSIPVIGVVIGMIAPTVGIYGDNTPCVKLCGLILFFILILFVAFMWLKLIRLSGISPVRAINNGREDVHFSSVFKLPISKKAFGTSCAWRQITSGKKQYAGAVIVTAILVFFMCAITETCTWFGDGGKKLEELFAPVKYDFTMWAYSKEAYEDIKNIVHEHDPYAEEMIFGNVYVLCNDSQLMCEVCDQPERFSVYRGRSCLYDNEILITEFIVDNYGVDIGDTMEINIDGNVKEFLITGYFNCSNDAGKVIAMNYDAYNKMRVYNSFSDENVYKRVYKLKDETKIKEIVAAINEKYDEDEAGASADDNFGGMDSIIAGVFGIAAIIYILAGVFIAVTVLMICTKVFAKEKQDYGVYMAMGLTSKKLRETFAIRFAIIGLVGSAIGILLTILFSDALMSGIYELFGMYNFSSSMSLMSAVVPIAFMMLVYYVFAYIASRKMKRLSPRILIAE